MAKALYILDPQNGFNHESVSGVFADILKFAQNFDGEVLVSKFINDLTSNFMTQLDWSRFSDDIDTQLIEGYEHLEATIFEHTTYSCMGNEVLEFLEAKHINTLIIVGVFTDVCVSMTAMESFDKGFTTYVLSDLVGTLHGEQAHASELKSLDIMLGSKFVIPSSQFEPNS